MFTCTIIEIMLIMMMVSIKFSLYLLAPLLDSLGVVSSVLQCWNKAALVTELDEQDILGRLNCRWSIFSSGSPVERKWKIVLTRELHVNWTGGLKHNWINIFFIWLEKCICFITSTCLLRFSQLQIFKLKQLIVFFTLKANVLQI